MCTHMVDRLVRVHAQDHANADRGGTGTADTGGAMNEDRFTVAYATSEIIDESTNLVEVRIREVVDRSPEGMASCVVEVPVGVGVVAPTQFVVFHETDHQINVMTRTHCFDIGCHVVLSTQPQLPDRCREGYLVDATVGVERHEPRLVTGARSLSSAGNSLGTWLVACIRLLHG